MFLDVSRFEFPKVHGSVGNTMPILLLDFHLQVLDEDAALFFIRHAALYQSAWWEGVELNHSPLQESFYRRPARTPGFTSPNWCCRWESNSRPLPYQGTALPLCYDSKLAEGEGFEPSDPLSAATV